MKLVPKATLALALAWAAPAVAKPVAPQAFCDVYPDAPTCIAGVPACTYCHAGTPPPRNDFGQMVESELLPGAERPLSDADFLDGLPAALMAVEALDADGDGFTNADEIIAGTVPADAQSVPDGSVCDGGVNPQFDVCNYDPAYAFKKVNLDFCGRSPTWDEMQAFRASDDQQAALHSALSRCLDSDFWMGKDGQLWKMAHEKIRPLKAIKAGEDGGPIPLGDYYDDYALFAYAHTDGHDVRELLTADYFVTRRSNPTQYEVAGPGDATGDQDVVVSRRAGMLTTRWNLVLNVMFTAVPRTAAAQAYRSFLGMDIARLEGLMPVDGEPVDYDDKGVQQEACAGCHSTLDPLTYPFSRYQGLTGNVGTYDPDRIRDEFRGSGENILDMPESGVILGQPVTDLTEWARVAANSNEFASATTLDYWQLLMGRPPQASEQEEFRDLWQALMDRHGYSVEAMLHQLIETEAYGVP